jgi:hypothetical protein
MPDSRRNDYNLAVQYPFGQASISYLDAIFSRVSFQLLCHFDYVAINLVTFLRSRNFVLTKLPTVVRFNFGQNLARVSSKVECSNVRVCR